MSLLTFLVDEKRKRIELSCLEQFPSSKPLGQDDPDPYVYSSLNKNRSDLHAVPRLQNNRLKWLYLLEICRYYFKPNSLHDYFINFLKRNLVQRSPSNDENLTRFFDYVVFPSSTSLHLFLAVFENAYLFVLYLRVDARRISLFVFFYYIL